jgi:hypothetical protein
MRIRESPREGVQVALLGHAWSLRSGVPPRTSGADDFQIGKRNLTMLAGEDDIGPTAPLLLRDVADRVPGRSLSC